MKITLEYCKNCRGVFNKIGSYIQWFLDTHAFLALCILSVLSVTCSFLYFENCIKDSLVYPVQEYAMLEEIANKQSNKKQNMAETSDLPQDIEFDISIKKDKIISEYYIKNGYNSFIDIMEFWDSFDYLKVTVEQNSSNFEIISIKRRFEENNFVSEIRKAAILFFTIFFFFILFILMLIIIKVLELLNKIGLEKRRKKYAKELNNLEKASKV